MTKAELTDLYKVMFPEYPDVVNVEQLSEMLGGVSIKTVYRLLNGTTSLCKRNAVEPVELAE